MLDNLLASAAAFNIAGIIGMICIVILAVVTFKEAK